MNTPLPPHGRQGLVLVVEDEPRSQRLLRMHLEALGYAVLTLSQATGVAHTVAEHAPQLVVLDLRLPDGDGFDVCQQVRATSDVPIIILSAFGQSADKARGLALGADDYVTKPFAPDELTARIEAVLRRVHGRSTAQCDLFHCGPLLIDFNQQRVALDGHDVALTRTEYRLLAYLARNAGRTLVADAVLVQVWGPEYQGDYASLHLYISRLRRKLHEDARAPRLIVTKPGIGYMMPLPAPVQMP